MAEEVCQHHEQKSVVMANAKVVRGLEDPQGIMKMLETIGRICHGSKPNATPDSAERFIRMIIRLGHESVLEHVSVTVYVECDRAMAQQWTRHRIAAYTMESQRYVTYKEVRFIDPEFRSKSGGDRHYSKGLVDHAAGCPSAEPVPEDVKALYAAFDQACSTAEHEYQMLRNSGAPPEDARVVLPNCTRTVFYTTANLRSWRHFFEMRCAPGAQHNIRAVSTDLLKQFHQALPAVFQDIVEKFDV